jgi:phytoene synthase
MTPEVRAAIAHCRWMIDVGSKSFSLAARIFDPETRNAAFLLYGWCRYCDDQVDQGGEEGPDGDSATRLWHLKEQTRSALADQAQTDPVFIAFRYLVRRYAIPDHYPLELLEGMAMDVEQRRYETFSDLLLYCYRVAGTVGLMMTHVMGASDEKALRHAADLGIAMQLTNIARDVVEDAERGRIYLPMLWLDEAGIPRGEILLPQHRQRVAEVVGRLLDEAERFYRSGDEGLRYLGFRAACAVAAARAVYAEIGSLVRTRGARAWDQRTYVSTGRKFLAIGRGVSRLLGALTSRWRRPWTPIPITSVWRYPEAH